MPEESTPTGSQGAESGAATAATAPSGVIVGLNDVVMAVGEMTSRQIRDLIRVSTEGIGGLTACGCDGGRCGCFGSDCPCNKVHNDKEDVASLPEFLKLRQEALANLRTQLAAFEADEEKIKQLGGG